MVKRPRSHQIGDAAIAAFNNLKPSAWVSREKGSDYGVDLEIEIFTDDGQDTGFVFNVQSKGTDNDNFTNAVQIKVETLRYLDNFDVPAIIFRHDLTSGKSFWKWASSALKLARPDAKTVVINFSQNDLWDDETPRNLSEQLMFIRLIKQQSRLTRFPICNMMDSSIDEINKYASITHDLQKELPFSNMHRGIDGVQVDLEIKNDIMVLSIGSFYSISSLPLKADHDSLKSCLSYLFVQLLRDLGFHHHAERVAGHIYNAGLIAPTRQLALLAAIALLDKPSKAVELALRNSLQSEPDFAMMLFASTLRSSIDNFDDRFEDVVRFYSAAIISQNQSHSVAALHYSLGNYLRSKGKYASAVRAYNQARKADQSYLDRTYFFKEIGGMFFLSLRYKAAIAAYSKLLEMEDSPSARLLLGDAYLYYGDFKNAQKILFYAFDDASSVGAEAKLKLRLANWLEKLKQRPNLQNHGHLFDLRKANLDARDLEGAFWSHLSLTFYFENDVECWADAIYLCLLNGYSDAFEPVLKCASTKCGLNAYFLAKHNNKSFFQGLSELMPELDMMVAEINSAVQKEPVWEPGVTISEPEKLAEMGIVRLIPTYRI